jgi:predicted ArsR family transcriptional regulator
MLTGLVVGLFNDPTRLKILSVTSQEPKSARDIANMFHIPLGRCYRKIKKLEEDGLLAVVDREPTEDGKKQNVYLSQLKMVSITYEIGRLTIKADDDTTVIDAAIDELKAAWQRTFDW